MNCLECQAWLQLRLDGDAPPLTAAQEHHWTVCATCREEHVAALRLLEGLKQIPTPKPPAHLARMLTAKVLEDRRQRQDKMRRRVFITMALAASVLFLLFAGYFWIPRPAPEGQQKLNLVESPPAKKEPVTIPKMTEGKQPHKQEPRNAITALTERWVDTTRDHARVVLVAASLEAVDKLPNMHELLPLDPSVREAGQEVSEGVRTVTRNTRRAFDFFARELPMTEIAPSGN